METRSAIVVATDVHKYFGHGETAVHALDGVTVSFQRGQYTAIMGPSGSGKSTLMHCLAGLDRPTSGSVTIDGVEITNLDDKRLTDLRARQDRLHLPGVQPAPRPDRGGEHHPPADDRGA